MGHRPIARFVARRRRMGARRASHGRSCSIRCGRHLLCGHALASAAELEPIRDRYLVQFRLVAVPAKGQVLYVAQAHSCPMSHPLPAAVGQPGSMPHHCPGHFVAATLWPNPSVKGTGLRPAPYVER